MQRFHTNRLLTQTITTYYHFIVTTNRSHAWDATNYDHYLPLSDCSQVDITLTPIVSTIVSLIVYVLNLIHTLVVI